ncbi:MAG: GAF domain-containing protein [Oscillochloris sp.]|nr:GAF domain-containing protein [Oscillochloris sp.]
MRERSTSEPVTTIDPRWVGGGFAAFVAILLVYALVLVPAPAPRLALLGLAITVPVCGGLIADRRLWWRRLALVLLALATGFGLLAVGLSGGIASPLWPAVLLPVLAALLMLPGLPGAGAAAAIWLGYGSLLLFTSSEQRLSDAATWLLQTAVVGLLAVLLERTDDIQRRARRRFQTRERSLRHFLNVSNRLRISSSVQRALEEVAGAVQAAGDFDCVSLSLIDWDRGQARVAVAIGASGRRLSAVEGLRYPYEAIALQLDQGAEVGASAIEVESLPFRSIPAERHLVLPLISSLNETRGLLTVSAALEAREVLAEALPLLELLANQAAAVIDNGDLYTTLEQRVQQSTSELERSAVDLRAERDRAEVLYHIARALSVTLDERQVVEQTLTLIAQHIGAERGGIMLVEPNTGRLVFRTTLDRTRNGHQAGLERGQGLAGWVLVNREPAIVPDTSRDPRWQVRSSYDEQGRAALAVPIMLEREALGVLILIHSTIGHFTGSHAQIAMAAAGQAAAALSKSQLYRYVSEQSEHLGVVARQREDEASKLMAILRSIGDGVVVGDRLGRIRIINPAAGQILGITSEAFIGRPINELPGVPADLKTSETGSLMQKFSVGSRTVRAHCAPVRAARGESLGTVVVYHDLTHEEAIDRLKSELVATASHELRTPMTSIRGYVDMLLLGTFGTINSDQRAPLQVIKNNVVRLVQLIDELLDMSRVEAGEVRLRQEPVDVATLIRDVTEVLGGQFSERDITLQLDLQEGLPPVIVDRQRIEQVAVNLIGNACKYTPKGGTVCVVLRNGGDVLRIDVHDTGVGIPEEARDHIFTPFYRADNPLRDEVGGTGLGLSITRRLVELHGGQIWFESEVDHGSTFSFTLPLYPDGVTSVV